MRNEFLTSFWRAAFESLPASTQPRYALAMKAAERLQMALDGAIATLSRGKKSLARLLQTAPRSRSAH